MSKAGTWTAWRLGRWRREWSLVGAAASYAGAVGVLRALAGTAEALYVAVPEGRLPPGLPPGLPPLRMRGQRGRQEAL